MNDLEVMELFDRELIKYDIDWSNKDIDTIEDDEFGDRLIFYVYYEEPEGIKDQAELNIIMDKFNKQNRDFIITELRIVNSELRAKFNKRDFKEEKILYL